MYQVTSKMTRIDFFRTSLDLTLHGPLCCVSCDINHDNHGDNAGRGNSDSDNRLCLTQTQQRTMHRNTPNLDVSGAA